LHNHRRVIHFEFAATPLTGGDGLNHKESREEKESMKRRVLLMAMFLGSAADSHAQVSVLTYHNDNMRTGQNLSESVLTPANVRSATFGRLFSLPVDGKVDAEPLLISGLTIPLRAFLYFGLCKRHHKSFAISQ